MSVYLDPDALALLFVQQYLAEQGYNTALHALEQASGIKYDDDKSARGSELMELVYQLVQQRLGADEDDGGDNTALQPLSTSTTCALTTTNSSRSSRQQQLRQQQAKLQEELLLRSAAADYPSFLTHSLGPLSANLLSVLTWPGQDLLATGAADGTVRLLRYGDAAQQEQQPEQQQHEGVQEGSRSNSSSGSCDSSSSEVWVARLGGAGGVLTLSWHPAVQSGRCSFAGSQDDPTCLLLAGCMDGSVHLLHAVTGKLLASAKPHSKYVVSAAWAPALIKPAGQQVQHNMASPLQKQSAQLQDQQLAGAGEQLVATASYDSSCCLLRLVGSGGSNSSNGGDSDGSTHHFALEVVQQVPFVGYVQDVTFLHPGAAGAPPSYTSPTANGTSSSTSSSTSTSSSEAQAASSNSQASPAAAGAGAEGGLQLVVAFRGTNCLNVLDVKLLRYTQQQQASPTGPSNATASSSSSSSSSGSTPVWSVAAAGLVNMSEAGDGHVSFSAMRLAVSPCQRYLLVATDSPILLVLRLADWGVVRRLYGLDVDKFHNASVAWHRSSSYILAGAAHAAVYVYHVGTAKVVATLRGHIVNVRSIHYDPASNRLATCSFDKCVKVYEQP